MKTRNIVFGLTALFLLASCGGGSKASSSQPTGASSSESNTSQGGGSEKTISINVWADKSEHPVIEKVVANYNEKAATKIKVNLTAIGENDAGTTLASDPKVANYPSLLAVVDDHLNNLVSKDIVAAVPSAYVSKIQAADTATAVTAATNGGKLYGFPVQADNGYFLAYDGDEITDEQAGSLESIMQVITEKNKTMFWDVSGGWYAAGVMFSQGVAGPESLHYKTDGDGNIIYDIGWDTPACATAAEKINEIIGPAYKSKNLINGDDGAIDSGFADGKMIAAITGTWKTDTISNAIENPKFAKLPTFTDANGKHQLGSFTGTKMYVVNKYATAEEQVAAFVLADLLTNKDGQLLRFETRSALPCNKEALADEKYTSKVAPDAKALNEQNAFAAIQATSAEDRYWSVGGDIGSKFLNGVAATTTWAEYLKAQCDILRAPAA